MSTHEATGSTWRRALIALLVVMAGGILALAILGSQVSGILSTVGASVGGPNGGDDHGSANGNDGSGTDAGGTDGSGSGSGTGSGSGGSGGRVIDGAPRDDLMIVKTGELRLQVAAIGPALTEVTRRVDQLGGYTSGSERTGTGDEATATITFRVPAASFDGAMDAVRGVATEVLGERSTTEDVTGQVVDLGARVRNLQVTERALQSIMDQATVIKDVLTVQAELTTVRGEIERLSAEKAHLEEQAAFSTLTVSLFLAAPPAVVEQQAQFDPADEVEAASARLLSILQNVATAGIWFGIVWLPIILALGLASLIGFVVVRRVRQATSTVVLGN